MKKIFFFAVILIILLINCVHNSYPDEFDNILGGKLLLQGIFPYAGYFAHHAPMGYFLSAVMNIFSGLSFVHFRVLSAIFFLSVLIVTYKIIKKEFVLTYIFVLAISSTYFWGHMFLADCLSGYFLIPAYGLLFIKIYTGENLTLRNLMIISGFSAITLLTSTTFSFAVAVLIGFTAVQYFLQAKFNIKKWFVFCAILGLPYLLFGLYLLLTNSWRDFLFDNYSYNSKYYIYNYPGNAANGINPIRYAISIINNFINNYQVLLSRFTQIDFMNPFNITLAISNALLWIYLFFKKKYWLILFTFLLLAFANVRSNPLNSRVTDYQSAVYFFLTFFNFAFLFWETVKDTDNKPISSFIQIVLVIFWFFNLTFLSAELWRMTYNRYMGQMPLIYDWPQVAPIVNKLVPTNHYCWVGPFEFEENYYLNCRLPSKYTWILPQFANSPEIQENLLKEYNKNKPDVIVFNRNYSAFFQSSDFNKFFTEGYLNNNYYLLADVPGYKNARFKNPKTQNFNFNADFNFRKDIANELVKKLIQLDYVSEN